MQPQDPFEGGARFTTVAKVLRRRLEISVTLESQRYCRVVRCKEGRGSRVEEPVV